MTFLYPAFLLGALAIAIPIALHFLRRDIAPEVPFSAVRLLNRSPVVRTRKRRLRDLLLLAARVAALLLLALAFARPYRPHAAAAGAGVRIVAVDRSFSMGSPGRFEQALAMANAAIDDAPGSERVAVIAFDDRADLLAAPGSAADARAALAGLHPGFGATRYAPVFSKAAEAADGAHGRLVVITDLQRAGWEDEQRGILPGGLELDVRSAGPPAPNIAVTALRLEPERVIATMLNATAAPLQGEVRIEHDGRVAASSRYSLAANATTDAAIAYRAPAAGSLAVVLDDPNGAPADNRRFTVLDARAPAAVLVLATAGASESGFYFSRAFAAAADAGPDAAGTLRVVSGATFSAMTAEEMARHAAVVLLSTRGVDRRARESVGAFVRGGGGVLIAAAPDVDPAVLGTMFGWQAVAETAPREGTPVALSATDLRHPIFRPFGPLTANLGQVRFSRTWRVGGQGWEVVARFTDGSPALLERRDGAGRIVLFASDLDRRWNDFPLNPAFVPFAVEAVRYISATRARPPEYLVSAAPAGTRAEPGVYRIDNNTRAVVVNVDARESSTDTIMAEEFTSMVDRLDAARPPAAAARAQQEESRQSYWVYGLMLMLGALVAESFVGRAA